MDNPLCQHCTSSMRRWSYFLGLIEGCIWLTKQFSANCYGAHADMNCVCGIRDVNSELACFASYFVIIFMLVQFFA